ncbi:MAG: cytochrome c oxidase subunit II [Povalibacter sp.]
MSTPISAHSALVPTGVHAQHIDTIWHVMLWTCGLMYALVLGFVTFALIRAWQGPRENESSHSVGLKRALYVWFAMIAAGLFGLSLTSFLIDRAIVRAASDPQVSLRVTANQWWWEVEYTGDPSRQVRTANEIHLPVNAQVHVELSSNDVIHSFWVPNLHGKQDLIPGRTNEIRLQPLQTGSFRGFCAEFCGAQHAKMDFEVVVDTPDAFAAWTNHQLSSAVTPGTPETQAGQQVFMSSACNMCHAISGTDANGTVGPDLSHFASRRWLASGTAPNTPSNLRSWLENPQRMKPGSHMPVVQLKPQELDALVAYIGSLK